MFYFGVDFYPEHWPEDYWPEAARLMAEARFNVVRLAEFAWSKMEPKEGQFDFSWLDSAIDILAQHDMRIVLGTPTASPPAWLLNKYPDIFRVREDQLRLTYGNRREYCPSNRRYIEYSSKIVGQMAQHYAHHPAVIGWQIDNEFGERCYCPNCAEAFRKWLHCRYQTLDELNDKWGTVFWSHTYGGWEEIPVPLTTGGSPNPGLALDFYRFSSDSYQAYQQKQIDLLREKCPQHFITHNCMGFKYDRIDYFNLARPLDFVAWDNYPSTQWSQQTEVDPSLLALAHASMRGLKRRNFWVIEQQAGPAGWEIVSTAPRPGQLRLWAYQSIAHGADGILFFRWRTNRFGTEQHWHGLLDADGRPGRRYEEVRRMGCEITKLGGVIDGSIIKASIAMLHSYEARFAFQIQANNPQFSYPEHFHQIYKAFYDRRVPVDIVCPTDDLGDYKLVIAPALHIVSEAVAENLKRFVQAGGVLVVTPRSGVKDEANAVVDLPLPGLLAELCGVKVEEYDSLLPDMSQVLEFVSAEIAPNPQPSARVWCDILAPEDAEIVARYTCDFYAGKPAITINQYGQGKAIYVGTFGDKELYDTLADWVLRLTGLQRSISAPAGIEVTERWQGDRRLLFILNHTARCHEITLDGNYTNLLDGSSRVRGTVVIPPHDVLILTPST